MTDDPRLVIRSIGLSGSFYAGGPLDGSGFFIQVPVDTDLTGMRVSLPRADGTRDLYTYDPQPDPESLEAGMRYIGTVEFTQ